MIEVEYIMKALQAKLDDAEERNAELVATVEELKERIRLKEQGWKDSSIPTVLRPTGRTIPDLTKREHICEWQSDVLAKNGGKPHFRSVQPVDLSHPPGPSTSGRDIITKDQFQKLYPSKKDD